MAEILNPSFPVGTRIIRCAQARCHGINRVDGCFSEIKITLDDIKTHRDFEGDWSYMVDCPACGITLYPLWQIGEEMCERAKQRDLKRNRNILTNQD